MSAAGTKYTVQSFSGSLRLNDEESSVLPLTSVPTARCRQASGNERNVVTVRPVLKSGRLTESFATRDSTSNSIYSIGNQLKTKTGVAYIERDGERSNHIQDDNWQRARSYNEHVAQQRREKAQKLLEFQREVKLRVKRMEDEKQQAMLAKTYREVELERKVAHRTAFLAQASIPNASDVMVVGRNDLLVKSCQVLKAKTGVEIVSSLSTDDVSSTSTGTFDTDSMLSGSVSLPSLCDTVTTVSLDGVNSHYTEENIQEVQDLNQTVERERRQRQKARHKLMSRKLLTQPTDAELPGGFWRDTATVEYPPPVDEFGYAAEEEIETDELVTAADEISLDDLTADDEDLQNHKISKHKDRRPLLPISGQDEEEVRKQEVKQRALLRRLYMDMEREQVKEYKKLKSHMDRIAQIKKVKEDERARQELQSDMELFPPACPSATLSEDARVKLEKERRDRKEKETKRYVKALRSLLREKIERLGIDVPPLCSCGENIWDTHPDMCANNCPFYKNPKGYERAVQALLTSCDINKD